MRRKRWLGWLVCVVLGNSRPSAGASPVLEGLDPTIFGSVLDLSTSRFVNSGEELRAYLSDVTVSTLLLNGALNSLSSEDFVLDAKLRNLKSVKRFAVWTL